MKKLLLVLVFISTSVFAASEEADALCNLYKAKAELSSSILASPYIYGNSNESNTATVGIAYSLSGRSKGQLAKEIAQAKCDSSISVSTLDEQQKWLLLSITKASSKVEIPALYKARDLAKENLAQIEKQLVANTSTIIEYNNSKQVLLSIEEKINSIRIILAEPSIPVSIENIQELLTKARISEGLAAELSAKQEAANAWDISLAAGAQKNLSDSNSSIGPFVGIGFKWSFGSVGLNDSITNIRSRTETAFNLSQSGYVKTAERLFAKVSALLVIEQDREKLILDALDDTNRVLGSLRDLNSEAALGMKRSLTVQQLIFSSELQGIQFRINKYSGIKN